MIITTIKPNNKVKFRQDLIMEQRRIHPLILKGVRTMPTPHRGLHILLSMVGLE